MGSRCHRAEHTGSSRCLLASSVFPRLCSHGCLSVCQTLSSSVPALYMSLSVSMMLLAQSCRPYFIDYFYKDVPKWLCSFCFGAGIPTWTLHMWASTLSQSFSLPSQNISLMEHSSLFDITNVYSSAFH